MLVLAMIYDILYSMSNIYVTSNPLLLIYYTVLDKKKKCIFRIIPQYKRPAFQRYYTRKPANNKYHS